MWNGRRRCSPSQEILYCFLLHEQLCISKKFLFSQERSVLKRWQNSRLDSGIFLKSNLLIKKCFFLSGAWPRRHIVSVNLEQWHRSRLTYYLNSEWEIKFIKMVTSYKSPCSLIKAFILKWLLFLKRKLQLLPSRHHWCDLITFKFVNDKSNSSFNSFTYAGLNSDQDTLYKFTCVFLHICRHLT